MIHEALPQLIKLDGVLIPSVLQFDVPAIPTAMYRKASKYVNAQDQRIRIFEGEANGEYIYYFLSMSQTKHTKYTTALAGQYQSLLDGKRPRGITQVQRFIEILDCFHVVWESTFSGAHIIGHSWTYYVHIPYILCVILLNIITYYHILNTYSDVYSCIFLAQVSPVLNVMGIHSNCYAPAKVSRGMEYALMCWPSTIF